MLHYVQGKYLSFRIFLNCMLKTLETITIIILTLVFFANLISANTIEPAYQIVGNTEKFEYDAGENITLNVIIDGMGNIQKSYVYFYAPPYLMENKTLEFLTMSTYCKEAEELSKEEIEYHNKTFKMLEIEYPYGGSCCFPLKTTREKLDENSFTAEIPTNFFEPDCPTYKTLANKLMYVEDKEYAPLNFFFRIPADAPAGEHQLYLSFAYVSENKSYLSHQIIKIKIRTWYEEKKWQYLLQSGALLATIVAFLTLTRMLIAPFILLKHSKKTMRMLKRYKKKIINIRRLIFSSLRFRKPDK